MPVSPRSSRRRLGSGLVAAVAFVLTTTGLAAGFASGALPPGGSFVDDDGNIHEGNIEAIASIGVTKGCNPPANDRYCPTGRVTRGQMAAFLGRALGLPSTTEDFFVDDDLSIFEGDINRLAASGITKGCNPPANDRFCPDRNVTRGEMAAFLVRAFGYTDPGPGDWFVDDDGSIFENDIDRLRVAGVTKGCNPPANDRFCPNDPVLRDQMASFLARALGLTAIVPPPPGTTIVPWNPDPSGLRCDFDGDGYEDLAVGAPGESVGTATQAGAVLVFYGSAAGLTATGSQLWTQDSAGVADTAEADDRFGSSTACGDYNGDGWSDLAIGVPGEDIDAVLVDTGAVHVLLGSASGLQTAGAQMWSQSDAGVPGDPLEFDAFGTDLAAADFDGDGCDDLAIGVPGEDATVGATDPDKIVTGGVNVLYGSLTVLTTEGAQLWTQDSPGIPDVAASLDEFGAALAAGDITGDGLAELVVGAPGDTVGAVDRAGSITVIHGSASGLTATGSARWTLDSANVDGVAETGDELGRAVAVGDIDNDGKADAAAGIPGKKVAGADIAGAVSVLFGAASGLTDRDQLWSQDSAGIDGDPGPGDLFGWSLAIADLDGDSYGDLAVGIPLQDAGGVAGGGVGVLFGGAAGLTDRDLLLTEATAGMVGTPNELESFGETVRALNADGDGRFDLAIGIPEDLVGASASAGSLAVVAGAAGGLDVAGNSLFTQDSAGVPDAVEPGDFFGFVGPVQRTLDPGTTMSSLRLDRAALATRYLYRSVRNR